MQIRIYETVLQKPNGDRDTSTHPSSSFQVVLVNGDQRAVVFKNDQFDQWWCTIKGSRVEYLNEAMEKAEELAKTLGAAEIVGVEITKHEKRAMDLEASIKRDRAELAKLREKIR